MARARGANARMIAGFEPAYGVPATEFLQFPFIECDYGGDQALLPDDLLGQGRDPSEASLDVINVSGSITVPVDLRYFGHWLKLLLGAPTTTAVKATGSIAFSANPAPNSTITLGGVVWTFVAAGAAGAQTNIGANLAATLTALATDLNASADTTIKDVTYTATATALNLSFDVTGPTGNAFTLAASTAPASNGTASGPALAGGGYVHVFESGGTDLPSMSIEIGSPEVPSYELDLGSKANSLALDLTPSGKSKAVINLIGQGYAEDEETVEAAPDTLISTRFSQFQGAIRKDGVPLANVTRGTFTYTNNLDVVRTIRDDGKIEGADEAVAAFTGQITSRFADRVLLDAAVSASAIALEFGYRINAAAYITFSCPKVRLPKPKRRISGPAGIEAAFDFQGAQNPGVDPMLTVTLANDVEDYS